MIGWLVRILLLAAGVIAGWFVSRDALSFSVVQFVVVLLVLLAVSVATIYLPFLRRTRQSSDE